MKFSPRGRFPFHSRGVAGYATAVAAVVAAAVAYDLLPGLTTTPSALFMLAIAAVAAATGYGPAMLAATLSGLAMNYVVLRPEHAFPAQPATLGAVIMFFAVALIFAWVANRRQAAEHAQHKSEELLRVFHETSPDGFMVFQAIRDQEQIVDFEYTYANPAALRIVGNDRILGRRLLEQYPAHASAGGLFERYARVVETGESHDIEFLYEGEDIRGWFRNMSVKMGDGVAMVFSDITARKEAEEKQRLNEQRFRAIFDRAGVGISEVAEDDRFIAVNDRACEILGYTREELLAMNVHELTWPEDRLLSDRVNAQIHEAVLDRTEYEKRYQRADGSPVWVHVTVSAVRDTQGNWIRSITTFVDLTARQRAEEALRTFTQELETRVADRTAELERTHQALRQSERLATLGQAMAILSHENRNALQNCLAALQLLRRTVGDNEKQQRYLDLALNALEGLRHAYEDIRQYAAPMKLDKTPASMEALWRATWAGMASRTAGRNVRLLESCDGTASECEVDPARFQQVFRNLIENSLDACPDPVEIRIGCEPAMLNGRPALRITVCDNGPGMRREEAQRVTEPFFTTKSKGTGVGLAVVRRIVEAHDGRVAIDTEEGRGFGVIMEVPKSAG